MNWWASADIIDLAANIRLADRISAALDALPPAEAERMYNALEAGRRRMEVDQQSGEVTLFVDGEPLVCCHVRDLLTPTGTPQGTASKV
jgi:hypothetical protein